MTIYGDSRGKIIDTGGRPLFRLVGLGIAAFIIVIALFSSVTRVSTGHVGVLTLFGRVTGEGLVEGIHIINPLKSNNEMSTQPQIINESASLDSDEGLVVDLDYLLVYHLNE